MLFLRTFGWALTSTALVLAVAALAAPPKALVAVATLAVLEVSLSFDNAVVNATVLRRMNRFWINMFLSVGILIAVFGMRLIFPFIVVAVTAGLGPVRVADLALNHPDLYAAELHEAHPAIAAFGGVFLMMIFLEFIFVERDEYWLRRIENVLARVGRVTSVATIMALLTIGLLGSLVDPEHKVTVLTSGLLGLATYLTVGALSKHFEDQAESTKTAQANRHNGVVAVSGRAAMTLFFYLEVLDASFSFDGVIAAFAISTDLFVIAAGLGVGALYVRSLTVYLVRAQTLDKYVYLEHGAHYAIGALAVFLLVSLGFEVPDLVASGLGAGIIVLAVISSVLRRGRRDTLAPAGGPGSATPDDALARTSVDA